MHWEADSCSFIWRACSRDARIVRTPDTDKSDLAPDHSIRLEPLQQNPLMRTDLHDPGFFQDLKSPLDSRSADSELFSECRLSRQPVPRLQVKIVNMADQRLRQRLRLSARPVFHCSVTLLWFTDAEKNTPSPVFCQGLFLAFSVFFPRPYTRNGSLPTRWTRISSMTAFPRLARRKWTISATSSGMIMPSGERSGRDTFTMSV